nr:hypothetical protein [Tanacetum cinerariifolium]
MVLNQGFQMYHLMTRRKNCHGTLPTMKMLVVMKKAKKTDESDDDSDEGSDNDSKTPKESKEESNDEEEQDLRLSEE